MLSLGQQRSKQADKGYVTHRLHDGLEKPDKCLVVATVIQRHVDAVIFPGALPSVLMSRHCIVQKSEEYKVGGGRTEQGRADLNVPRAWKEEVPVFVEGDAHDTVSEVESFLNTIAVVDVNVNVQHSSVILEELKDPEDLLCHEA